MTKRKLCDRCKRPVKVCYCQGLPRLENRWPVYILQYFKENRHPLGTAGIANLGLSNCKIIQSNNAAYEKSKNDLIKQQALLIYPGQDSIPIEELNLEKPSPLLFLDGTWRKTRRLMHESAELSQLQKISIKPALRSRYRIRKTPDPESLSTLEAIVYVLSVLEKNPAKYQPLLDAMDLMIDQQITLMGETTFRKNYQ